MSGGVRNHHRKLVLDTNPITRDAGKKIIKTDRHRMSNIRDFMDFTGDVRHFPLGQLAAVTGQRHDTAPDFSTKVVLLYMSCYNGFSAASLWIQNKMNVRLEPMIFFYHCSSVDDTWPECSILREGINQITFIFPIAIGRKYYILPSECPIREPAGGPFFFDEVLLTCGAGVSYC